jgi:hypothetical protein
MKHDAGARVEAQRSGVYLLEVDRERSKRGSRGSSSPARKLDALAAVTLSLVVTVETVTTSLF